MTSPPTSEDVPIKDKPKTTIDLPFESPIHINTTLHSSISSDLGSSTVMVSSIVCDEDNEKTPSPDMSVDEESPSRTVILSFARADVPDSVDDRQVIEEVVPAMVPSQGNTQRDTMKQDTKDNQDAPGIGLGLSILDDPPQDDDDIALQTAAQLLSLSGQKEAIISQLEALDLEGQFDNQTPTGCYNDGRMPGGLDGIPMMDDRPYPPVPVAPSDSTVSSATATSGFTSIPSYSSSLLPSASDGSSQGVQMIPPQADLPEVDRQQEVHLSEVLRNFAEEPEPVARMFFDRRHAQAQQIQEIQEASRRLPGVKWSINLLGDQPVTASSSATSDLYRQYADGTQPFDPVENHAHLQAHHQARVANIQADKDNRNKAIRARLDKDALAALQKEKDEASKGEGAATVPGMVKGMSKLPPKRKSAGARVMALRASKPTRKDTPVPVIPRRSSSRISSANSTPVEQGQSSLTASQESASAEATQTKLMHPFTLFKEPTREKPIKTYQNHGVPSQDQHGPAVELQPAATIYNAAEVDLNSNRGVQGDDESEVTDALDSDDTESGDAEIFDAPNLRRNYDLNDAYKTQYGRLLDLSLQVLADVWPLYEPTVTGQLMMVDSDDEAGAQTDVSRSTDSEPETLRNNTKVTHLIGLVEEIWGSEAGYEHLATLFNQDRFIAAAIRLTGDSPTAHLFIQSILNDIVEYLEEIYEDMDEVQDATDRSDEQGASDLAERDQASDETFDEDDAVYMDSQVLPPPPFTNAPLTRVKIEPAVVANSVDAKATPDSERVALKDDKGGKTGPVQHEDWMENDAPAPVKTKARKNKRKKKPAVRANTSEVPGSAPYYNKDKDIQATVESLDAVNALKASESSVSQEGSEDSGPEPTFRSPYATINIFDRLGLSEVAQVSPGNQIGSSHVEDAQLVDSDDKPKPAADGAKQLTASADWAQRQPTKAQDIKDSGLTSEPVPSWADSEPDPPYVTADPTAPSSSALPPPKSSGSQPNLFSRRGSFQQRWMGPGGHGNESPVNNAESDRLASGQRQSDVRREAAQSGLSTEPSKTRPHTAGLSLRDIREGATVEPHPIKGTPCVILREPLERPDYDCTVFVAGVPAYDEAVIPWQTSRAVIIDHFKKFGEVTKVKAVRDTASTGHVNAFVTFPDRETADRIFKNPQTRIISVPDHPNSYDRSDEPMTVMSRKDVEGKPWIDMVVRLEKAQGIRRVYFHFTGVSPQYAAARNAPILPRWLVPVPKKVAFESYLDPFGHDGYGREKYRLRRRLRDPVRPNFFEVNKRRDQIPYLRDECIEVEIDTTKEQESLRTLCELFGELEELRPWSNKANDGFEAIFYDRECAIRALHQIRLIPGVTGFWSHEKHGPKPPGTMDSYFLSLPQSFSHESGRSSSKMGSQQAKPVTDVPQVDIVSGTKSIKEEWPSLPNVPSRRKITTDLLSQQTSSEGVAELPAPRVAVDTPAVAGSAETTNSIRAEPTTDSDNARSDGRVDADFTESKTAQYALRMEIEQIAQSEKVESSPGKAEDHDPSPVVDLPSTFDSSSSQVTLTTRKVKDAIVTDPQVNIIRQEIPSAKVVSSVARPLTPSVRLSPAPSGDPKMTIIVENLHKSEPEESVKMRFRKYGRLVASEFTMFKKRSYMTLSYNSVHSARQAVEEENAKVVCGREQRVRMVPVPNALRQAKKTKLQSLPSAPEPVGNTIEVASDLETSQVIGANNADVPTLKKDSAEKISAEKDSAEKDSAEKDSVETQHTRQISVISTDTTSNVPLSGRKRAFSDPGDVKRPSTAGTDKPSEPLVPASLCTVDPPSATEEIHTAAAASAAAAAPGRSIPAGCITPLSLPRAVVEQSAVQMAPPATRVMPYQGFEYVPYADLGSIQYYSVPVQPFNNPPTFSLGHDQPSSRTNEYPQAPMDPQRYEQHHVARPMQENGQTLPILSEYPVVTASGLQPRKFSQTQYGLMPIYDPQELSKYRRQHGLHLSPIATGAQPNNEPPLPLLPLSSGGHSPTRLSFSAIAPDLMNMPSVEASTQSVVYGHYTSTQPQTTQAREPPERYTTLQSPEASHSGIYPIYLQNPAGQMYEYGSMHDYHSQAMEEVHQQSFGDRMMGQAPAYPGGHYPAADQVTPSGNSAYRAPMQLEPTVVDRRMTRGNPPAPLALEPNRPTLISQLAGYEHYSDHGMISPPPGFGQQDARFYNAPPFAHQYPVAAQQAHQAPPVAYPASANMSGTYLSHAAVAHGADMGITNYGRRASQASQRDSLIQPPHETHPQDPPPQLPTDIPSHPSVPAIAIAGRYPPLPMQSAAFQAATGVVVNERGAKGGSGSAGRKSRGMVRGSQGQTRGAFRR